MAPTTTVPVTEQESHAEAGLLGVAGEVRILDLAEALEIGGAGSLQVELAREQLAEAHAGFDQAKSLWLPDLWAGVGYDKHEGSLQETGGDVLRVSRNSGFLGVGLYASFDLADAFLEPRAAGHELSAAGADVTSSVNDALLDIALAYNDLLQAQSALELSREDVALAAELVALAEAFSSTGQGLEADAARARNELAHRMRLSLVAEESIAVRSARLARLLRLDPTQLLRASEPQLVPFALVPEDLEVEGLIGLALASRPELRSLSSVVLAEESRQRQESLRPFIPKLQLGLSGGRLGGGRGSDFDDFDDEGQFSASLVWGVRNLGFGESAARRRNAARKRQAQIQLQLARDVVAEDVTVAHLHTRGGRIQLEFAARNVDESLRSLDLNMRRVRAAEGLPIEALQAIQAAAAARNTYLESVADSNRAQLHLLRTVGTTPRR